MQKKIIALAVAGLVSGVAFAQTNVTVYGVLDVGYLYSKSDNLKFNGLASGGLNGNRIGFRGTEALGNGLNAVFQAEFGFSADQFDSKSTSAGGAAISNVRNSWVGLQHANYGTLTLGRQNSVAYDWIAKGYASDITGVHPSNYLLGDSSVAFAQLNSSDRVNNSVKYQSPNWNGFEVRAIYGFGEVIGTTANPGDASDAGRYGIGAAYKNGPIDVALIYQGIAKDGTQDTLTQKDGSVNGWSIGGSYDFKVVKLFAQYQMESNKKKNEVVYNQAGTKFTTYDTDKDAWTIGGRVPVGKAGTVIVEYVNAKADYNTAGRADGKAWGWGLGYEHAFSKRTVGYTSLSYINNDNTTAAFGKNVKGDTVGVYDENSRAFNIGVRHSF